MTAFEARREAGGRRFAIVASRFNRGITERLVEGARRALDDHGAGGAQVDVVWVPGAWELPAATQMVLERGAYAAAIAVGCVIRGETPHFEYVAGEAARGLGTLARAGVPVTFGLLTTETAAQAAERSGDGDDNKGYEAAIGALEMADLFARFGEPA